MDVGQYVAMGIVVIYVLLLLVDHFLTKYIRKMTQQRVSELRSKRRLR